MKYINIILLFLTFNIYGQFGVNIGIDPKVAIFGTDNQYTEHGSVINMHLKVEYYGRENDMYFAIGAEFANLQEEYRAWFADFGYPINITESIVFIPQLEIGNIFRENINNEPYENIKWNDTYYYGINIPIRWMVNDWLAFELEGSVDRASDLPHRDWRYGSKFNIIILL